MPTAGTELDAVLAKDYPKPIRELYQGVVRKSHPSDRHRQLLRLGEASLTYLAALGFADYRRARVHNPVPEVEKAASNVGRATTGDYLRLFRISQRALGQEQIFGIRRYEIDAKLEYAQRLVEAVKAVEHAQRIGAQDVQRAVDEGLRQPVKTVRWLGFWNHFVEYRNRVIHADDKAWPVDAGGYYEVMTPLLEAALVEALRTEYIAHVLLEYPIAELLSVGRARDGWVLRLDGEYRGAPLITEVSTAMPPEAWQSELRAKYILAPANGSWAVYSRFYDLRAGETPDARRTGATTPSETTTQAPAPVAKTQGAKPAVFAEPAVGATASTVPETAPPPARDGGVDLGLAKTSEEPPQAPRDEGARSDAGSVHSATWMRRAAAVGLDQLSIWTITAIVSVPPILVLPEQSTVPAVFLVGGFLMATALIGLLPARRGAHRGQTFGKQVLDIGAVAQAGQRLSLGRLLVRELVLKNFVFGLPSVFLLGVPALVNYLWPLWDRRSRAIHDHICATRVVGQPRAPHFKTG